MHQTITVGWREYVALPELMISRIKAKVDTGARTSCLHAFRIEEFYKGQQHWVRFWIHPNQKCSDIEVICEAKVKDQRMVRDSGGHEETRYVIESLITLGKESWPIEITLTNRENMAFRMLLGRTAMHNKLLVNPTKSFLVSLEEQK
ncbi:ATP-dependent zinc protease family protein [Vibrio sonorensis]|uniref:ATP-dependent zinc protease family protein n=1 Tax=Vibrio sonorensis TaxID=1004316 RepID=UPI0008D92E76|nr:ATP-dependent zinc protease [Vibrio sonorensis]